MITVVIILICVVLILASILGSEWLYKKVEKKHKGSKILWWERTIKTLLDAVLVGAVVALILETPLWPLYISRPIKRALEHSDLFSNPTYLRGTFSTESLRKLRTTVTRALCRAELPSDSTSFVHMLQEYIYPAMDKPLRYDFKIVRQHKEVAPGILRVSETSSCIYRNTSDHTDSIDVLFDANMDEIPGFAPKELYTLVSCSINGRPITVPELIPTRVDGSYSFFASRRFPIHGELSVKMVESKLIPATDSYVTWLGTATRGLTFTFRQDGLQHAPKFYLFGLGDEIGTALPPVEDTDGNWRWEYDGWLLHGHGIFLDWH